MTTCEDIDRIRALQALLAGREQQARTATSLAAGPGVPARLAVTLTALWARVDTDSPQRRHTMSPRADTGRGALA